MDGLKILLLFNALLEKNLFVYPMLFLAATTKLSPFHMHGTHLLICYKSVAALQSY